MKCTILILLLFLTLGGIAGCLGDPSRLVTLHNATDIPLRWDEGGGPPRPSLPLLQPGQTKSAAWAVGFGRKDLEWKFRAYDQSGNPVFCKRFTYQDLETMGWYIEIRKAAASCE